MNNQIEQVSNFFENPNPGAFYRTTCKCMSKSHDLDIELGYDEEYDMLEMTFNINCIWDTHWNMNWVERLCRRFKTSMRLLFTGRVDLEQEFIFRGDEHVGGILNALNEGVEKIRKNK